jgi:hypothetical protein
MMPLAKPARTNTRQTRITVDRAMAQDSLPTA